MFLRFLVFRAHAATISLVIIAVSAWAQDARPATHNEVLIRDALIMTATHGNIPDRTARSVLESVTETIFAERRRSNVAFDIALRVNESPSYRLTITRPEFIS